MIADDQELIRQSLQIVLNACEDIEVVATAQNGREVLSAVRRTAPDVILMDIRMPVMDGYDATRAIRALDRTDRYLPIVAMTADAFEDDVQYCISCGMNAHVAKPLDIKELIRVLHKFIHGEEME